MSRRGSLFYYGPGQQCLVVDGINRDQPQFPQAVFAANWAAKKGIEFVDHTDPSDFRIAGRRDAPKRGRDASAQREQAAAEAVAYPCSY